MKKQRIFFRLTFLVAVFVGIILAFYLKTRPIDWASFFFIMLMGFTLVWFIHAVIRFVITFLILGRRKMSKRLKKE